MYSCNMIQTKSHVSIRTKGFTLIELLIAMSIIGILATVAVELTVSFTQGQTFNSTVLEIRTALYSARSQAQSVVSQQCGTTQFNGVQVAFCQSKDKNGTDCSTQCITSPEPSYETDISCGPTPTLFVEQTNTVVPAITITPDHCVIQFQPFGTIVTGNGKITAAGFTKTQSITVTANGVIQ